MSSRREFIKKSALASAFVLGGMPKIKASENRFVAGGKKPIVISTWPFGVAANDAAWKVLSGGGRALDAVEAGVQVPEADPKVNSVGNCGAVGCLEHIMHPISVARKVMEKTPHVMLVGDGALQFALDNGFTKMDLLTPEAKTAWEKWKKENNYTPKKIDMGNHDTIGMVAIDNSNNISGACTTSGLAWKLHGRVGDSPIIGAGMYVDNEVGGACSTGKGEANMKIC